MGIILAFTMKNNNTKYARLRKATGPNNLKLRRYERCATIPFTTSLFIINSTPTFLPLGFRNNLKHCLKSYLTKYRFLNGILISVIAPL